VGYFGSLLCINSRRAIERRAMNDKAYIRFMIGSAPTIRYAKLPKLPGRVVAMITTRGTPKKTVRNSL
jgi:hypothetical protein